MSADDFLRECLAATPETVFGALRTQAAAYRRPPPDLAELLGWLAREVPRFAAAAGRQAGDPSRAKASRP